MIPIQFPSEQFAAVFPICLREKSCFYSTMPIVAIEYLPLFIQIDLIVTISAVMSFVRNQRVDDTRDMNEIILIFRTFPFRYDQQ